MKISLWQLNTLSRELFVRMLGGVFEHSPWVADEAWKNRPFHSTHEIHVTMMKIVGNAPPEQVLALIRAHPDLATRLQISEYSALEQQGAGLDRLTEEEYELFSNLNRAYVQKFGFPFIYAVRGKTKEDILSALEARIGNTVPEEREKAVAQIGLITRFRIMDLVDD
ncbi:2-oxo-4-hydroxy-4-carboxy-5-ureidoimidazoline decarboxylase [Paenibacillus sp. sptzw28]|uniref:2-oxo-4-hydroxy-4-carboxy-5-ureidoimidazoline decarboxylase n=1 Tax=Paenibacillus sp. sptzw28 TaxID=715179 RepID=UPI001C6DEBBB|nr:2-oxo-4-hydroxy-4-carboxy-5-ureidoimidazoline decarboxylase [Paenibacillus sp. sptzw28]QYR19071.1 2-oxo-4-hydroxy-4-carboxy-5-ureidoimidazoline decarboxylase [Paenibacillus sp. sptzw28]